MKSNLKELRKEAGLTLEQLGDKAGVCTSQIYELQKDGANPKLETATRIAAALKTNIFHIWATEWF